MGWRGTILVGSERGGQRIGGQGFAEVVSLNLIAVMRTQKRHLLLSFDAFRDHVEIQASPC
jgi:hypothetical protein